MSDVLAGLAAVRERIANAERASSRPPGSVTLVAVSKRQTIKAIEAAYLGGQRHFGENYAQELAQKAEALAHLNDIQWHFIGNLQRNKAKIIAAHAHTLHTLDSAPLAHELHKRLEILGRSLDVLVEVNVAREEQKHGVLPEGLGSLVTACAPLVCLHMRGLMTVPPADDEAQARACFRGLAALLNTAQNAFRAPAMLSMGMSDDLETAIAAGATFVRVGSAIFGPRAEASSVADTSLHRADAVLEGGADE